MKTNIINRKLIAFLLSIVTIIGCFSGATAFAEELNTNIEEPIISSVVSVPSHETNFGVGGGAIAFSNIPVYYDVTLSGSYQVGTILSGEGFTVIANDTGIAPYYCIKVEYNTSSGAQQGYISQNANFYQTPNITVCLAHVQVSSTPVYYGAESGYYQSFGTVYYGEFVAVIGRSDTYQRAFIEYNAANGQRKRGYVSKNALYYYSGWDNIPYLTPFDQNHYDHTETVFQYVRSGPSETYPSIGNINNESVCVYGPYTTFSFNGSKWKYITYAVTGTNYYKAGYIKVNP